MTIGLLAQVVITDSNKYIDVDIGAGEVSTSIATGTYDDMKAVASALETALQVIDATFSVSIGENGKATISKTGTLSLLWKTGTHGSDNTDTHIGTIIGYDDSADDTGASSYISDYQHMYGWYTSRKPIDSYDRPQVMGAETFVAVSGTAEKLSWGTHENRELKFNNVGISKIFSDYSSTNEDFVTFWAYIQYGYYINYYSDTSVWTLEGQYALKTAANEHLDSGALARYSPGAAFYTFSLRMVKQ